MVYYGIFSRHTIKSKKEKKTSQRESNYYNLNEAQKIPCGQNCEKEASAFYIKNKKENLDLWNIIKVSPGSMQ